MQDQNTTKACLRCRQLKQVKDFSPQYKAHSGSMGVCKACVVEAVKLGQAIQDGQKRCRQCRTIKGTSEFRQRRGGVFWPRCKSCEAPFDDPKKELKRCSRCLSVKPFSDFDKDPRYRLGLRGFCRPCMSASRREMGEKYHLSNNLEFPRILRKICSKCKIEKEWFEFTRAFGKNGGLGSLCKDCKAVQERKYKGGSIRVRATMLNRLYGLTLEEVDVILEGQSHKCAICLRLFCSTVRYVVDHCHQTGKVRGLLCDRCNNLMGHVDDSERLEKALKYKTERS